MLALMAHNAVVLPKGPFWPVALGRRDGMVSGATESSNELPPSFGDVPPLGLKYLVVLSGAHKLGTTHCPSFVDRLYNSIGSLVDPSLDSEYAAKLKSKCKSISDGSTVSEIVPGSYKTLNTNYYRHVAKRRGLFLSEATLLADATTREYVHRLATGTFDDVFFRDFSESIIKMGNVGILTRADGDIRKKCYVIN